jgi:hypothetical protein
VPETSTVVRPILLTTGDRSSTEGGASRTAGPKMSTLVPLATYTLSLSPVPRAATPNDLATRPSPPKVRTDSTTSRTPRRRPVHRRKSRCRLVDRQSAPSLIHDGAVCGGFARVELRGRILCHRTALPLRLVHVFVGIHRYVARFYGYAVQRRRVIGAHDRIPRGHVTVHVAIRRHRDIEISRWVCRDTAHEPKRPAAFQRRTPVGTVDQQFLANL